MATKGLKSSNAGMVEIKSFKDAGYQGAKAGDTLGVIAKYVVAHCPDFPEMKEDDKAKLFEGYGLRWQETNEAVHYTTDWIPCSPETKGASVVTLDYCLSFSTGEFGKLKDSNPIQHSIVKNIRDKFTKYRSNRFGDLARAVNKLKKEMAGDTSRKANKTYDEFLNDTLDGMITKNKTALSRGEPKAIKPEVLLKAIAAFKAVLSSAQAE